MLITSTVEVCIQQLGRVEEMVFTARRSYFEFQQDSEAAYYTRSVTYEQT